ncbi:polysaccharide pyruvyl transferase family protein [Microbacterium sp. Marseille-Q6965]|uniref:polysaccharide pyruvyl transferase family protein n=1 Tax=Microbacterium sp. Marseille-Q6965 TaxID=2965072 RepID=UPI0021B81F64|nr:polysaccharide pyruvyl transferase family protein [Microbacterium sp. Marseille-Q6965]
MTFDGEMLHGVRLLRWAPDEGGQNFGDELGPLIARRIIEAHSPTSQPERPRRLVSIGSVLHLTEPGDVVWGAGINGKAWARPPQGLDIRAVRGPYTRAALLALGNPVPDVYGDPGLLLPRFLPDLSRVESGDVLVVPNLNDRQLLSTPAAVDPRTDPVDMARMIAGASYVIASSLHALVLADAFGVPSRPVLSSNEHPFKYVDYYAGTGRSAVRFATSVEEAHELGPVEPAQFDAERLLAAFPLDLWGVGTHTARNAERFSELRSESQRERERVVAAYRRNPTPEEALAYVRIEEVAAGQAPYHVRILEDAARLRTPSRAVYLSVERCLATLGQDAEVDRRIERALWKLRTQQDELSEREMLIWELVIGGEVETARRLLAGEVDVGTARSSSAAVIDGEQPQAGSSRGGGSLRRLFGRRKG